MRCEVICYVQRVDSVFVHVRYAPCEAVLFIIPTCCNVRAKCRREPGLDYAGRKDSAGHQFCSCMQPSLDVHESFWHGHATTGSPASGFLFPRNRVT